MIEITSKDVMLAPQMSPKSARQWATFMHLSLYAFFVLSIFGFVVPLVLWVLKREESAYVDAQGKTIFNFILSLMLYGVVYGLLVLSFVGTSAVKASTSGMFGTFGFAFAGALLLVLSLLILPIFGVLASSKGDSFRYPLTIAFRK
jgi:uncharacterized Tic20 family protein